MTESFLSRLFIYSTLGCVRATVVQKVLKIMIRLPIPLFWYQRFFSLCESFGTKIMCTFRTLAHPNSTLTQADFLWSSYKVSKDNNLSASCFWEAPVRPVDWFGWIVFQSTRLELLLNSVTRLGDIGTILDQKRLV